MRYESKGSGRRKNATEENLRRWRTVEYYLLQGVGGLSDIYICYT